MPLGGILAILGVRRRLSSTAARFLAEHGLTMSLGGRVYLWYLLSRAAVTVVRDGRVEDIEIAERSVLTLLTEASGMSTGEAGPSLVQI